uniref:Uncharacterized protein n=1 Tax=Lygus hesperus TaxID=30085 RepID=A0A146M463_LYGHE
MTLNDSYNGYHCASGHTCREALRGNRHGAQHSQATGSSRDHERENVSKMQNTESIDLHNQHNNSSAALVEHANSNDEERGGALRAYDYHLHSYKPSSKFQYDAISSFLS